MSDEFLPEVQFLVSERAEVAAAPVVKICQRCRKSERRVRHGSRDAELHINRKFLACVLKCHNLSANVLYCKRSRQTAVFVVIVYSQVYTHSHRRILVVVRIDDISGCAAHQLVKEEVTVCKPESHVLAPESAERFVILVCLPKVAVIQISCAHSPRAPFAVLLTV